MDRDVRKQKLVAVEYGDSIVDVEDALVKKTADDLVGAPQYAGYATTAYSPKPVRFFRRIKQFAYEMMGIVSPPDAPKNMMIDLGIIEEA